MFEFLNSIKTCYLIGNWQYCESANAGACKNKEAYNESGYSYSDDVVVIVK